MLDSERQKYDLLSQILEFSVHCKTLAKERRKTVTLGSRSGSRFYTITRLWVVFSLSTLYFKTVDWSLTTARWESVCEQALVGREEMRTPLKTPQWEVNYFPAHYIWVTVRKLWNSLHENVFFYNVINSSSCAREVRASIVMNIERM